MEIKKAFKILDLDLNSSKEEINSRFKKLSKKLHLDAGGSDEEMTNLNLARELALNYSKNKALVKVVHELTKSDNFDIQKSIQTDKEVSVIYKRAQRRVGNKLKAIKRVTGSLGLLSALATLVSSKIVPVIDFPKNSEMPFIFLLLSVCLGFYFLFFTDKIKRLEETIEDFKDGLDDKEYFHELLSNIFRIWLTKEIRKNEFFDQIESWAGINRENIGSMQSTLLLSNSNSPKRVCRIIGIKDFSKILILKGKQYDFIEIRENKTIDDYEIVYKVL
ncbi:hypothetical protein [Flavobacterium sp.]|uniref:hypothetical protein n=1 Tax=Flavobacterium sp. TaxID=239 RepID=UPI00261A7A58|nr:hypothetical protein [Flavobacterium sp.]